MAGRPYSAEEDALIIETIATLTTPQQAARLPGRSVGSVHQRRCLLAREGRLDRSQRVYNRPWTEDELAHVDILLQQGHSVAAVARKLKRSIVAIYDALSAAGSGVRETRARIGARVRSASEVAALFGLDDMAPVRRWIARGWLRARRNDAARIRYPDRARAAALYLITDDAIQAFIACRENWVAWEPAQITDPAWRAYAQSVRDAAGGRWVSATDLARQRWVTPSTVLTWYTSGRMAGIATVKWRGGRFFWSADLEGWEPADRRGRKKESIP